MSHQKKRPKYISVILSIIGASLLLLVILRLNLKPKNAVLEDGTVLSWGNCWFDKPLGRRIHCGKLSIPPSDHNPEPTTLSVVVFQQNFWRFSSHPVLYLSGGPGGSLRLNNIQDWFLWFDRAQLRQDLVLVDQRGVGLSQPNLSCPQLKAAYKDYFQTLNVDPIQIEQQAFAALNTCRQALRQSGHDLSQFTTHRFAQDSRVLMSALQQGLGYQAWNVYGVSYGTKWAQELLRTSADKIRSVILDAVLPRASNALSSTDNYPWLLNHALERFFKGCESDSTCAEANPNLRQDFLQLLRSLNAKPRPTPIKPEPDSDRAITVYIDGYKLQRIVFDLLYSHQSIDLPRAITAAAQDNFADLHPLLEFSIHSVLFDHSFHEPIYYSVTCAEDYLLSQAEYNQQRSQFPTLQPFLYPHTGQHPCDFWQTERAAESFNQPIQSNIPTLLLSGENDPVTPPIFAEQVQKYLKNSQHFVIPDQGHGAVPTNACAIKIMNQFLRSPGKDPLNDRCLSDS